MNSKYLIKQKKCKVCKTEFTPWNTLQRTCSPACAIEDGKKQREREFKEETRRLKKKVKSRSEWMRDAQIACNRYIRARDAGKSCISCGRNSGAKINAGHYRSVGSCPELRFNELNIHQQCEHCNSYLSGNAIEYRKNLRVLIGEELLEYLEGPHEAKKYTIEELKEIKQLYNYFANQLEKELTD